MKELELAQQKLKENRSFFKNLSKKDRKALDQVAEEAHDEAFSSFDCLTCANCCKTTGPLFTKADIDRLAKVFSMKSSQFIEAYLRMDEEGDYVLQTTPCPFLLDDNKCLVYDQRPKACREFPHTNRKNFYQIRNLTLKNTLVCPIAFKVVENIKANYPF
ncbi:YkgJ family cysteine cluster protein [Portibacter lacus]|uniref:Zinc/iron-chelating domain-containing protein n=1 Tax=Portibacter lacus TaxID=1099794 RepID=A0AA37WE31_9BACT|nr:YkgJ family cysteine cluster protein [Portibacter lacus]GLR16229.1 zinc/iron-chelating domain-containing protein [Portibacter lacus]